LILYKR